MPNHGTPESVRLLLARAVDYAGLFPPASLSMEEAARNYAEYRAGPHEWMLGRFVVPVDRMKELAASVAALPSADVDAERWPLSVLIPPGFRFEQKVIPTVPSDVMVGGFEVKVGSVSDIALLGSAYPKDSPWLYCEIPLAADISAFADAAAVADVQLKARTGGITHDAFPAVEQVVGFLRACIDREVAFKLTAGLHHMLRGEYRLTYEPDSACGPMFGFLNVLLAAALVVAGGADEQVLAVLTEADAGAVAFDDDGVTWRETAIGLDQLRRTRSLLHAFGSCSFVEPVEELTAMRLLR